LLVQPRISRHFKRIRKYLRVTFKKKGNARVSNCLKGDRGRRLLAISIRTLNYSNKEPGQGEKGGSQKGPDEGEHRQKLTSSTVQGDG